MLRVTYKLINFVHNTLGKVQTVESVTLILQLLFAILKKKKKTATNRWGLMKVPELDLKTCHINGVGTHVIVWYFSRYIAMHISITRKLVY